MACLIVGLSLLLAISGGFGYARTSGIIYGCRYNPALCTSIQVCVEDNLFGTCQGVLETRRVFQFHSTEELEQVLAFTLKSLLKLGYGWRDDYTQCIIGGLLEEYGMKHTPDLAFCDKVEKERLAGLRLEGQPTPQIVSYDTTTDRPVVYYEGTTPPVSNDFISGLSDADLQFIQRYLTVSRPVINLEQETTTSEPAKGDNSGDVGELSETDRWLLEQLTSELITVDDLSTSQIRRLRAYLQIILSHSSSPSSTSTKNPDLSSQSVRDGEETTLKLTTDEEQSDKAMLQLLKTFTAESMDKAKNPSDKQNMAAKGLGDDAIGQRISDQLKLMEHRGMEQYVDKKSESLVRSGVAEAPEKKAELMSHPPSVEAPDKEPELTDPPSSDTTTTFKIIDTSYVWLTLDNSLDNAEAADVVAYIAQELSIQSFVLKGSIERTDGGTVYFQVSSGAPYNSTQIATKIQDDLKDKIQSKFGVAVLSTGIGHDMNTLQIAPVTRTLASDVTTVAIIVTAFLVLLVILLVLITWRCMYNKWSFSKNKFESLSGQLKGESTQDSYEDLCRQRMQTATEKKAASAASTPTDRDTVSPLKSISDVTGGQSDRLRSPRSSTSSWSEEPVNLTMDISTGHTVLAYMEDHLKNTERLEHEWSALGSYTPDRCDVEIGKLNATKNRYPSILPYDHNRVKLRYTQEEKGNDYINASFIADHDPRTPAYIATQGPLQSTVPQFWQMVWEQDCTSIVMLTSLAEHNKTVCHQYWPSEGRHTYGDFEVHLVSEHIWCEAYLVRSFYLKNIDTNQTRTVTQFHFLAWPELSIPGDSKDLLDFRRKVNKSYRGKTSPIVVCCSDGSGRSGTYILLDMVINRIHKGVKEIDIAATLEHVRDQRMDSVHTREQFECVLSAVAEEVQALLKALPQ